MHNIQTLRSVLRILAVGSILMVLAQLAIAARNLESPSNDAVRLAGLGLPLLFLAFLNLIVWSQETPGRTTRMYTHFANGLLLIASFLVARAAPVTYAFAVSGFTVLLVAVSFLFEINSRKLNRANQ